MPACARPKYPCSNTCTIMYGGSFQVATGTSIVISLGSVRYIQTSTTKGIQLNDWRGKRRLPLRPRWASRYSFSRRPAGAPNYPASATAIAASETFPCSADNYGRLQVMEMHKPPQDAGPCHNVGQEVALVKRRNKPLRRRRASLTPLRLSRQHLTFFC